MDAAIVLMTLKSEYFLSFYILTVINYETELTFVLNFSVVNSGAYRIINGTCAHKETSSTTLQEEGKCPELNQRVKLHCRFNTSPSIHLHLHCLTCLFIHGLHYLFNTLVIL